MFSDACKIRELEAKVSRLENCLLYQYEKMDSLNKTIRVFMFIKDSIRAGMTEKETEILRQQCGLAMKAVLSDTDLEEYEFWDKVYNANK